MSTKDFKFDDDAFNDIFSSSDKDEFEDVFSDNDKPSEKPATGNGADGEFEDVFSGRDDEPDEYNRLIDEYPEPSNDENNIEPDSPKPPVNMNVEKKPYSYNYNKASREKAHRVSQDRIYDDISDDISSGKQPKEKKAKKKVSAGKVIAIILCVVILIVAVLGVGGYGYAKSLTKKVNYSPLKTNSYITSSELMRKDGVTNILLVGVDAREGESNDATRSDTMMLLTIDNNNQQIKLTSFLRDTYIEIPGYKWAKLNAAQSHGGTQLLVDTLEYNFKIDIDNYMLVNFDMFTTIIDSLGGVDVEITEKEAKYINSKDHMTLEEASAFPDAISSGSSVHLTGAQALWYARIRYLDSDFMRTGRQRKVISAIVTKAKTTNPAVLVKMLNEIVPMIETDLDSDSLMNIGMNSLKYLKYDIAQQQIPADKTYDSGKRNGQDVLLINLEKNRSSVQSFVFDKAQVESTTE